MRVVYDSLRQGCKSLVPVGKSATDQSFDKRADLLFLSIETNVCGEPLGSGCASGLKRPRRRKRKDEEKKKKNLLHLQLEAL